MYTYTYIHSNIDAFLKNASWKRLRNVVFGLDTNTFLQVKFQMKL